MKKILVLSSFPAPYRVEVFRGLTKYFALDIFFSTDRDQNRTKEFFSSKNELNYYVLTCEEDRQYFDECAGQLKRYALVLAYDWYLSFALKVEFRCLMLGVPYAINCDGAFVPPIHNIKDTIKGWGKSFFVSRAALCLSSGKSATEYFRYYGAKERQITEHHFSSIHEEDILQTSISANEKIIRRGQLGLGHRKMVLAIGQFIVRKGFDVLLDAWKSFDKTSQLVIIGGGEQKKTYQKLIMSNGYKHVKLMDYMPKEKVYQYYMAADLFVLPTREDVWGLVINEAMAKGVPVIASDRCNAALELVENGVNGLIVPVENVEKLSEAMDSILQKGNCEIQKMGSKCIEKMRIFTIEKIILDHSIQLNKLIRQ